VIREFDLVSGESRTFEGHSSWVLCLLAYVAYNPDGSVKSQWLLSGSDDNTVRIWDIKSGKCLEELIGHKNGVTSMTLARNDLFTGSYDTCTIRWSLQEIESKIRETQIMMAEDLKSRKFEAFEAYMESKGKRKKATKKKGKKK